MSQMSDLPPGYDLLAQGCRENYDDSGYSVTWVFDVPAAIRSRFLLVVAGLPQPISYGGTSVTRLVPLQNPSVYNCYASSISGGAAPDAIAAPDGVGGISFDYYRYAVTFTTPTFSYDGSEPMVSVDRDIAMDSVTAPGTGYVFPSDGTCSAQPVDMPVLTVEYGLTFHRLPALDNTLYDALAGTVNSADFRGVAAGHGLYLGCKSSGQLTLAGQASYEATHGYKVRSVPWQQVMRPDGKGFEAPVWAQDTTRYRLPTADHNQLYGD